MIDPYNLFIGQHPAERWLGRAELALGDDVFAAKSAIRAYLSRPEIIVIPAAVIYPILRMRDPKLMPNVMSQTYLYDDCALIFAIRPAGDRWPSGSAVKMDTLETIIRLDDEQVDLLRRSMGWKNMTVCHPPPEEPVIERTAPKSKPKRARVPKNAQKLTRAERAERAQRRDRARAERKKEATAELRRRLAEALTNGDKRPERRDET